MKVLEITLQQIREITTAVVRHCCAQGQGGKFITNTKMLNPWKNEERNPSKDAVNLNIHNFYINFD